VSRGEYNFHHKLKFAHHDDAFGKGKRESQLNGKKTQTGRREKKLGEGGREKREDPRGERGGTQNVVAILAELLKNFDRDGQIGS